MQMVCTQCCLLDVFGCMLPLLRGSRTCRALGLEGVCSSSLLLDTTRMVGGAEALLIVLGGVVGVMGWRLVLLCASCILGGGAREHIQCTIASRASQGCWLCVQGCCICDCELKAIAAVRAWRSTALSARGGTRARSLYATPPPPGCPGASF